MNCKWCKKQCYACELWPNGRTAAKTSIASLPFFLRWLMWWDMVPTLIGFGIFLVTIVLDLTVGLPRWWVANFPWLTIAFVVLLYLGYFFISVRRAKIAKQAEVDFLYESFHR